MPGLVSGLTLCRRARPVQRVRGASTGSHPQPAAAQCPTQASMLRARSHSGMAGGGLVGYARIAHLSAPRVTSTVKYPSPSGLMTSRPRAWGTSVWAWHHDRVAGASGPWAAPPGGLNIPLAETLPAAGQEDPDRVRCPDDLGPDLKEAVYEFHGLDVGHRRQHRAPEPLAGETRLPAPRHRLKRRRDLLLQGHGR